MYSNNILNFQESTAILNACTKKSGNLLNSPHNIVLIAFYHNGWHRLLVNENWAPHLCIDNDLVQSQKTYG